MLYFSWMDLHECPQIQILDAHINLNTFYVMKENTVTGDNFVKWIFVSSDLIASDLPREEHNRNNGGNMRNHFSTSSILSVWDNQK